MDSFSVVFLVFVFLFCFTAFIVLMIAGFSLSQKLGKWYVRKVNALNENDLPVFAARNIVFPGLIFILFLLPIILYFIYRPSFFNPDWLCFLFAGAQVLIVLFQIYQYWWLRTKKKT